MTTPITDLDFEKFLPRSYVLSTGTGAVYSACPVLVGAHTANAITLPVGVFMLIVTFTGPGKLRATFSNSIPAFTFDENQKLIKIANETAGATIKISNFTAVTGGNPANQRIGLEILPTPLAET